MRQRITQRNLAARLQARLLKNTSQHWNRGEDHPKAKLTEDAVRAIRSSDEDPKVLAGRYGVGVSYVGSIKRGRVWKHVS